MGKAIAHGSARGADVDHGDDSLSFSVSSLAKEVTETGHARPQFRPRSSPPAPTPTAEDTRDRLIPAVLKVRMSHLEITYVQSCDGGEQCSIRSNAHQRGTLKDFGNTKEGP